MATMHPWLANHPDAIVLPSNPADLTPETVRRIMAVCSREALADIANVCMKSMRVALPERETTTRQTSATTGAVA